MVNYEELMTLLSVPRPNGSEAEFRTRRALQAWLDRQGITHRRHSFRLYPFFFEPIGIWLIASRTLLAAAVLLRWGWPALVIALVGLIGGLLDVARGIPLITFWGAQRGENILIEFGPPAPRQELVLSAHYDTKTELLDHQQRMFFLKNLRLGILLTVLTGLCGAFDGWFLAQGASYWANLAYILGIVAAIPLVFLAWGLGLNLSLGRLAPKSAGAVDNGSACAILLGLAHHMASGALKLEQTRLTIALFTGEEVNMQGSRAFTRSRDWPLPAAAVNLEVMAQDGEYVFWELDGTSLKLEPTSGDLNQALSLAVQTVTGQPAHPAGPLNSDGGSFLMAGIPSTTLGTYHSTLRDRGFHRPTDNLERVVMERLPEGVNILTELIRAYDQGRVTR